MLPNPAEPLLLGFGELAAGGEVRKRALDPLGGCQQRLFLFGRVLHHRAQPARIVAAHPVIVAIFASSALPFWQTAEKK